MANCLKIKRTVKNWIKMIFSRENVKKIVDCIDHVLQSLQK